MCTIACAWQVFDEVPLVIGANREERWDRVSEAPRKHPASPAYFAPTDLVSGGTWIGVNASGLVAAVTNRPDGPEGSRSRGLLVQDLLSFDSVSAAHTALTREFLEQETYAGCNVLVASAKGAHVVTWNGTMRSHQLEPGIHVIVNRGTHERSSKASVIRARLLGTACGTSGTFVERLPAVLSDHGNGTCVHLHDRGTRSSSIVRLREECHISWMWSEGPPCQHDYVSVLEGEL